MSPLLGMSPVCHSRCMCSSIYSTCFFFFFFLFFHLHNFVHIYILEYIQFQCNKQLLAGAVSTTLALPWVAMPLQFYCLSGSSTQHVSCWCLRSKKENFFIFLFFYFFWWGLPHPCSIGMSSAVVSNSIPSFVVVGSSWDPSNSILTTSLIFSLSSYGLSKDSASSSLLQVAFDFLFFLGFCHM